MPLSTRTPLIAIVGCDGSGKSTITAMLHEWLSQWYPTTVCHLGKQSGNIGRALARLPLFGARLEQSIQKKAKKAQTEQGPSLITAVGIYAFTIRRERRFQRMLRLRRAGNLIIADRFPQTDIAGPMDGPGLSKAPSKGFIGWLARREHRKFTAMAAHKPDLIIRLNVSLDVAIARKPDHRPDSLARKIHDLSQISFGGTPLVDLNADAPLDIVFANAQAAIIDVLKSQYGMLVTGDNLSNIFNRTPLKAGLSS